MNPLPYFPEPLDAQKVQQPNSPQAATTEQEQNFINSLLDAAGLLLPSSTASPVVVVKTSPPGSPKPLTVVEEEEQEEEEQPMEDENRTVAKEEEPKDSDVKFYISSSSATSASIATEFEEPRKDLVDYGGEPMDMDAQPPYEQEEEQPKVNVPLLDYLCAYMECTLKELQVLFFNIQARKRMLSHLRTHCVLHTIHLGDRNIRLHAHDLSAQNANLAHACNGYLDITVRQYFYIKHGRRLRYPYLPCLIEFGGGSHASYYPLEVIAVQVVSGQAATADAGAPTCSHWQPQKPVVLLKKH